MLCRSRAPCFLSHEDSLIGAHEVLQRISTLAQIFFLLMISSYQVLHEHMHLAFTKGVRHTSQMLLAYSAGNASLFIHSFICALGF